VQYDIWIFHILICGAVQVLCEHPRAPHLEAFFSSMTKLFSLLCIEKRPKSSQIFGEEYSYICFANKLFRRGAFPALPAGARLPDKLQFV